MKHRSEDELLQAYRATGDKKLIGQLFDQYRHLVFSVCYKYLRDEKASEDIMMDVFEKVLKKDPEKVISEFRNWLYTLAKNSCIDYMRSRNREAEFSEQWAILKKSEQEFMEIGHLNRLLYSSDEGITDEALSEAMQFLDEKQRVCLELFFFKKMSYKEIAVATDTPLKAVKSHLQNGKRQLKKLLLRQTSSKTDISTNQN